MVGDTDGLGAPIRHKRRWGLGDAVAGLVVAIIASNIVAGAWLATHGTDKLSLGGNAVGIIGLWVGLLGVPIAVCRRKGSGRLAEDFGFRFRLVDAAAVFVGIAGQLVLVPLLGILLGPVLGHPDVGKEVNEVAGQAHGAGFVGLAVVVAVGAPVVEELFFRGLLLRSLQHRFGSGWAIAGSAVVFGLVHANDSLTPAANLLLVVDLVAFGAVLAILAVRTGRLGPGIWAHAAFNALTVAALALNR